MLIRSKAPLRISFAGGGTDVRAFFEKEGGCVLNATINHHAWGSLRHREDGKIQIESVDLGLSLNFDVHSELRYDGKLDLVKAAIRNVGGLNSAGFDLFLHSDAPPGSGLGSSSTLMVTLVGLLQRFKNAPLTDYEISHLAYLIEREHLGIKGGMQDQYAAAFGGFNFIEFEKQRVIVNPLRISPDTVNELEHNLLLCYTGTTRASDRIIDDQVQRYQTGCEDTLSGLRQQKQLAVEMKNALLQRRLDQFGELLHNSWEFKKRISSKISNPRIDEIYESARENGALGGKITGAGGGGYMLFYCRFERKHQVAEAVRKLGAIPTPFAFEFNGLQTWSVPA
ncbi:MAG TPA: GHMP kinase [Terriglobia bacterium]|nr:GHMP kinase [Terriglobia bacterium]